MALNPSTQDKRHGATRVEPNRDGSFWSVYPNGDKPLTHTGSGSHQAAAATGSGEGRLAPTVGQWFVGAPSRTRAREGLGEDVSFLALTHTH